MPKTVLKFACASIAYSVSRPTATAVSSACASHT